MSVRPERLAELNRLIGALDSGATSMIYLPDVFHESDRDALHAFIESQRLRDPDLARRDRAA